MAMSVDWMSDKQWRGTRAPLVESTGLHPDAYTDDAFFQLEQERLFERSWVCVGVASEVADGERMLVRKVGSRSIVITRDGTGNFHGFVNSCRHRGTELAETDCDINNTIRCPYHRWTYSLDGNLIATPLFDEVPRPGFDKADFSLIPVRVETWGPLLFACMASDTPALSTWLGDLPERMAGYRLDEWVLREQQEVEIAANWKLITENFQEYYHLRWVHPELSKVSRVADHYRYQGPGMYCGQTTTPVSDDDRGDWLAMPARPGLDESDGCSGRFVALFPNVMLSVLPNHIFLMRLEPVAPGVTRETCTFLLPPESGEVSDEAFESTRTFWLEVNDEDINIVQRSQRGLTAGHISPGPLAPRFEEPLHRFQNMVADMVTLDSLNDLKVPIGDTNDEAARLGTAANPTPPAIDLPTSTLRSGSIRASGADPT